MMLYRYQFACSRPVGNRCKVQLYQFNSLLILCSILGFLKMSVSTIYFSVEYEEQQTRVAGFPDTCSIPAVQFRHSRCSHFISTLGL